MVSHHRRAALQAAALLLSYSAIEIGGCIVGINSTVSPTSDASTHYVGEPVLRTGQDHLPAYQAIWKMSERGGLKPPMPETNSWSMTKGATFLPTSENPWAFSFLTRLLSSKATTLNGGASIVSATAQSFVRAGIAPAVFLVWRVYSPLRSLLR